MGLERELFSQSREFSAAIPFMRVAMTLYHKIRMW